MNATKERQAWCCLQVKLCDPCLSALYVPWCKKALYKYSSFLPFLCAYAATLAGFQLCNTKQKNTCKWAFPVGKDRISLCYSDEPSAVISEVQHLISCRDIISLHSIDRIDAVRVLIEIRGLSLHN